jgi:hypothetical protein
MKKQSKRTSNSHSKQQMTEKGMEFLLLVFVETELSNKHEQTAHDRQRGSDGEKNLIGL